MRYKLLAIAFSVMLIGLLVAVPAARADAANHEVVFTVNTPVEVPGVVLLPGKYDMKFLDDHIVEIIAEDGNRAIGYFEVSPALRTGPIEQLEISFTRPEAGGVPRLKEVFCPGAEAGFEFHYPSRHVTRMEVTQLLHRQ
jgi:hypothetical protein